MNAFALALHGGAGTTRRAQLAPAKASALRTGLERALQAGYAVLSGGGSSLEAVTTAVMLLEDDPLFNAGRGAVFNAEGRNELDAAIMDGARLRAGAVAALTRSKNPVLAARAVMEKTPHLLLVGESADRFAQAQGIEQMPPTYFHTESRRQALERARQGDHATHPCDDAERHGTVGAVALDRAGNLAAATSTGGHTNKLPGRVGDSPIIGAGTYADNACCAISCTGDGEIFIRLAVAHEVSARMRHLKESLADAAHHVIMHDVSALGGSGGLIAVDPHGNIAMPFNCEGMYRACIDGAGRRLVALYRE